MTDEEAPARRRGYTYGPVTPEIYGVGVFGRDGTFVHPNQRIARGLGGHGLIVGEAPSRTGDPDAPCTGRVMDRICDLAHRGGYGTSVEVTRTRYLRVFDRTCLLSEWPGAAGRGSAFPVEKAAGPAQTLIFNCWDRPLILLGRRVESAFLAISTHKTPHPFFRPNIVQWAAGCADGAPFFCVRARIVVVPHPSGASAYWNDKIKVSAAAAFWAAYFEHGWHPKAFNMDDPSADEAAEGQEQES